MLDCALNAAHAAGQEILKICTSGKMNVNDKSDGSPVTDADLRGHAVIENIYKLSSYPILSKESVVPF
jgi:3'-phosphoadenosine 5'-phosphosulfate (PAPS) 3'-phosphatase